MKLSHSTLGLAAILISLPSMVLGSFERDLQRRGAKIIGTSIGKVICLGFPYNTGDANTDQNLGVMDDCNNPYASVFKYNSRTKRIESQYKMKQGGMSAVKTVLSFDGTNVTTNPESFVSYNMVPAADTEFEINGKGRLFHPDSNKCVAIDGTKSVAMMPCADVPAQHFGTKGAPPPEATTKMLQDAGFAGATGRPTVVPATTTAPSAAPITTAPSSSPKAAAKSLNVGSGSAQRGPMKGVRGSISGSSNAGKGNKSAVSKGDPHFKTFAGKKFDFHGGCDLVLLQHPEFSNKLGMDINIRTKIESWWSYIDSAVIRIGKDKLEVTGGDDGGKHWINGLPGNAIEQGGTFTLSGFMVHVKQVSRKQKQYRVDLGYGNAISLETYKNFVAANVNVKYDKHLIGSRGLMGSYPDGKNVARDGVTIKEDPISFGKEWQVLDTEPMLFNTAEGPQHPKACSMPSATQDAVEFREKRRLGEAGMTKEDAEAACAHADPEEKDACIFDVLATQDRDLAGSY